MSNILNLLNQRTVALASLGACATIAAYCIYSRKSWSHSKIEEAQQAAEREAIVAKKCATVSACTTASSDSGLTSSDGFDLATTGGLDDHPVRIRRGRGDSGIVDDSVVVETDGMEAARELELVAGAICQDAVVTVAKDSESVAKDIKSAVTDFESVVKDFELVAKGLESIGKDTKSVDKVAESVAVVNKSIIKDATRIVKDTTLAPSLSPQFIEARLRVLSNAPDNAALMLVEGDADVLIKRLSLLGNNSATSDGSGDAELLLVGHLQLIGRLLLSPQRAETLCRTGRLYEALADVYERHAARSVEIRVRCVLALASARASGGSSVAMVTDLRLAPLLADDAVASDRLRPHALRLLGQLGPACHPLLTGRLPSLLARLRRLGSSDIGTGADDVGFCLIAGLLVRMLGDSACRAVAFSPSLLLVSASEAAPPSTRRLKRDVAMRTAWLDLLAALSSEDSRGELAAIWWPATGGGGGSGGGGSGLADRPIPLAGAIRAQMSNVYKQVKKLAGSLKSSEKRSSQGKRLLAVKKDVKALKRLAKHKPKPTKKK